MSGKRLLIYLLVLAAVVGGWLYSRQQGDKQESAKLAKAKIVSIADPLGINTVELSGQEYPKAVRIERREKKHAWRMIRPVDCTADSLVVGRLIDVVLAAHSKKTLDKPGPLKDYGLDPPQARVKLTTKSGSKADILVGYLSPTGKYFYAAPAGGGPVWMLPASQRSGLIRTLFDLRDKTVLDFVVDDVTGVDIELGGKKITLERVGKGDDRQWRFADGGKASTDAVADWLYLVHGLRAQDFIDTGIDLKKMGLAEPKGRVTLAMAQGPEKGLLLGGPTKGINERYVARLSGGPVLVVKAASLKGLATSHKKLAERRIWKIDRDKVVELTIDRGGKSLAWAKTEGVWRRSKPPGDEKTGAAGSLFVWDLAELKWEQILPPGDYGLENPQAVIKVKVIRPQAKKPGEATAEQRVLTLGKKDPKTGLVPARVNGDARIFGLDASFLGKIPKGEATPAGQGG